MVPIVVGYISRKLKSAELRYATVDREALAVVLTCRQFHHYLRGKIFTVITDHQPLVSVFKRKIKSPRMNRWILEMREYNYKIQYIKGKYNRVADQLSRPVLLTPPPPADTILGKTKEEIRTLQLEEGRCVQMIEYLEGGNVPRRNFPRNT